VARQPRRSLVILALLWIVSPSAGVAQYGADSGEWRHYSGDAGSTKYSPLDQIDATNVDRLEVVWRRPAVAPELRAANPDLRFSNNFRSTPLMVGGVLFASNGIGLVEAFDPATGETIWVQELPDGIESLRGGSALRGVAFWEDGDDRRIVAIRGDRLYTLDAATGHIVRSFGDHGFVDLRVGLGPEPVPYYWTGAPLVVGDVVVVGQSMPDNPPFMEAQRGDVRAYDVRSGEPRWTFRVIPGEGEYGVDTWENGSWAYTGAVNLWSLISADPELGLVYLPLTAPTSDMYGGHRLGDNLFSNSLVAVDAATGDRVWHFQTVRHDLWDFDLPAAPILADITVDGRDVKAVIQITKQGIAWAFDRATGEPVWSVEERPVPPSTVPGERAAPTQPFPTRPPPFDRQGVTVDDLIDFTPELRAEAIEIASRYVLGPMYTPPSIRSEEPGETLGTLQLPGSVGGADWNGAAFDPETGFLYVPSVTAPFVADLVAGDPENSDVRYLPFSRAWVEGPRGLPLLKPPYGRITAIDMSQGAIAWVAANGDGPRHHSELAHLDLPPLGQPGRGTPLLTRTLLFVSEGDAIHVRTPPGGGGNVLRAFDKKTGEVIREIELDAGTTGAAMTYMHSGRQYIVVAIGSRTHGAEFVALALP
jgi:quinoprotein glucose dehydrogenase